MLFALTLALLIASAAFVASEDPCSLPKVEGFCRAQTLRFHFNQNSGKCEAFLYGGCQRNANNFQTLKECHQTCSHKLNDGNVEARFHVKTPHCLNPPVENPLVSCRGYFPMFTFDAYSLKCKSYIYGGCGRTANMYTSLQQCLTTCYHGNPVAIPQQMPSLHSSSRGMNDVMLRSGGGRPKVTIENDAVVLSNQRPSLEEENICQLPPVTPHLMACMAFMPKWTFDARQGKCVSYTYGGCHGTKNLFDSQEDCETACPSSSQMNSPRTGSAMWIQPPFCQNPPLLSSNGPQCQAYMPKYTFNSTTGQCVPYIYGGCGGSQNLFDTEVECQNKCDLNYNNDTPTKLVDVCSLEIDPGPCRGTLWYYGFNKNSKRCEKFFYGGCKGNANRFFSVESCVNTCGGNEPETDAKCKDVTCDVSMATFMKAKGCVPKIKPSECCPSSWDCSLWEDQRLERTDECFWADDLSPNGNFYAIGDEMPEANKGCKMGCSCLPNGRIMCATPMCFSIPIKPGSNCSNVYNDFKQCCPDQKCDADLEALTKCEAKGKTFYAGQKFQDPDNYCQECLCQNDGSIECHSHDCGYNSYYFPKLLQGCVPIFREGMCCPADWVCPSIIEVSFDDNTPTEITTPINIPSMSSGGSVVCPPGINPNPNFVDYVIPPQDETLDDIATIGMGAPEYLSIAGHENCLGTYKPPQASYTAKCLPSTRPYWCVQKAWEELQQKYHGAKCPERPSIGLGAPEYLSIAGHEDCLGTYQPSPSSSYTAVCLPSTRPSACIPPAWVKLLEKFDGENCPRVSAEECTAPEINWSSECTPNECDACFSIKFKDGKMPPKDLMCMKKGDYPCIWTGNLVQDGSYVAVTASSGQCRPFSSDSLEVSLSSDRCSGPWQVENGVGTRPGCLFCNGTVDMVLEPVRGVVGLGIGAPEYLSIAGHQDCLGTYQPSPSYTANCLPSIKPSRCTSQAWTELGQKFNGQICPTLSQSVRLGAPEYLSIAGHQDCLQTYQPSPSYTANCLPSNKPSRCTSQAWTELGQKYDGEKCPDSRQPKQIAVTLPAVIGRNSMGQATPVTLPAIVIDREGDKLDPCLARRPPTDKGPCEPYLTRWTFDLGAKLCREYQTSYEGNEVYNHFETLEVCEKTCTKYIPQNRNCMAKEPEGPKPSRGDRCMPRNKYRFNEASGKCEDYSMKGCGANRDSYATRDECEIQCSAKPVLLKPLSNVPLLRGKSPDCNLPTQLGKCRSRLQRYYYDTDTGICRKFIYSGCQGNANNYETKNECIATCVPDAKLSKALEAKPLLHLGNPCQMKKEIGNCRAMMPHYYFDVKLQVCKLFFYGGCGGNSNRFSTLQECKQTCTVNEISQNKLETGTVCQQTLDWFKCPKLFNPDEDEPLQMDTWAYDPNSGQCTNFHFMCKSQASLTNNMNRFDSHGVCQNYCGTTTQEGGRSLTIGATTLPQILEDPCLENKVIGTCRAAMPRFYFDKNSGQCKDFFYGGCSGNQNNFLSRADCERKCSQHLKPVNLAQQKDPICSLPLKQGNCKAYKPRFYYNSQSQKCEKFIFGGCQGNENNFPTFRDCVKKCAEEQPSSSQSSSRSSLASVLSSQTAIENPNLEIPPPQCVFNGTHKFNLGDVLKHPNDDCTSCVCSSPPSLTCYSESCANFKIYGNADGCEAIKSPGSCCIQSLRCPKPDQGCRPFCTMIGFLTPPNAKCKQFKDECGCDRGYLCVE